MKFVGAGINMLGKNKGLAMSYKNVHNPIERPIFVVGCGRSGSTLLYNLLCAHSDLAWFSTYTTRFNNYLFLATLSRLYPLRLKFNFPSGLEKTIPKPSEGYELWDIARPLPGNLYDPPLSKDDVRVEDINRIRAIINKHLLYQHGFRFINKNTRNTRRIGYLDAIFPDALFIHIVRDPRASVASLLKVDWWPEMKIWNQHQITPTEWSTQGKDSAVLAAKLWRDETRLIIAYQDYLPKRFLRVQYEDLISRTNETLQEILDFCDLQWNNKFAKLISKIKIKDMNNKYRTVLSSEKLDSIKSITMPILREMGYQYY